MVSAPGKKSVLVITLLTVKKVATQPWKKSPAKICAPTTLEGETIKFYHFGDLSGPLAGITGPLIHGFEDAVSTINENGGIRGAQVEIEFTDTQSSVDEAVAAYDRYTSEDDNVLDHVHLRFW